VDYSDVADLCDIMPGTVTVTYLAQDNVAGGFAAGVSVPSAERRELSYADRASNGLIGLQDRFLKWVLSTSKLGAITPAIGDRLVDEANVLWVVVNVGEVLLKSRWPLICRQAQVA
jgi:hypothetical protein